jgi:hypothetical protein
MRAVNARLRRLENALPGMSATELREQAAAREIAEQIEAARRKRLGPDYRPPEPIPSEVFAGCRTIADHIIAARSYHLRLGDAAAKP